MNPIPAVKKLPPQNAAERLMDAMDDYLREVEPMVMRANDAAAIDYSLPEAAGAIDLYEAAAMRALLALYENPRMLFLAMQPGALTSDRWPEEMRRAAPDTSAPVAHFPQGLALYAAEGISAMAKRRPTFSVPPTAAATTYRAMCPECVAIAYQGETYNPADVAPGWMGKVPFPSTDGGTETPWVEVVAVTDTTADVRIDNDTVREGVPAYNDVVTVARDAFRAAMPAAEVQAFTERFVQRVRSNHNHKMHGIGA